MKSRYFYAHCWRCKRKHKRLKGKMKTKSMEMPKNMPMAIKKKRTKREQEIYDSGYHNGIQKGKREKIEEIKRILEIEQERSIINV